MGNHALLLGSHHPQSQEDSEEALSVLLWGEVVDDRDINLNKGREE